MNRTDRLLAVVLELQGQSWTTAAALARQFGISERTVYRDVVALTEAGVPVVSVPGRGYTLMPGYFLPPLHLSVSEAVMLSLGADAVRAAFDPEYAAAAESALKKLTAALPHERRAEVTGLRERLRVVPPDEGTDVAAVRVLRGAVLAERSVTFTYHKPGGDPDVRRVFPLSLVYLHGAWLLGAFDPARGDRRTFRLSRIERLIVEATTFERDPAWRTGPEPAGQGRTVTVHLRFPPGSERALRERPSFFQQDMKTTPDGVSVTLRVRDGRDVLAWVLSWGGAVRVLEPEGLREAVRTEARAMLAGS
ncbi:putative DNA-binding transcriptional regulator YafY [Deinococcus metalli]|uniref:Transcriptional regulator n=1 Tax=Deinococcus metalli TaxID=1141878 RepID=A0A7W8KKT4_9DEIO|nr:YafY family protein [Deinococcus metalli]MBB5378359.1 putative DNA-binding transcriptional regulator YafY [Deinococcus metalli]GHF59468.1 transcriptional regulator [Deinococcus metalli]